MLYADSRGHAPRKIRQRRNVIGDEPRAGFRDRNRAAIVAPSRFVPKTSQYVNPSRGRGKREGRPGPGRWRREGGRGERGEGGSSERKSSLLILEAYASPPTPRRGGKSTGEIFRSLLGAVWGASCGYSRGSLGLHGGSLAPAGDLGGQLWAEGSIGQFGWPVLGLSWGRLWPSWSHLEASRAHRKRKSEEAQNMCFFKCF